MALPVKLTNSEFSRQIVKYNKYQIPHHLNRTYNFERMPLKTLKQRQSNANKG